MTNCFWERDHYRPKQRHTSCHKLMRLTGMAKSLNETILRKMLRSESADEAMSTGQDLRYRELESVAYDSAQVSERETSNAVQGIRKPERNKNQDRLFFDTQGNKVASHRSCSGV